MNLTFALAGNQNCGKTTLFNELTGSRQHVGNFPGVTVERKEGQVRRHKGASVVDLPGIYSLSPYTAEEVVTRDFLLEGKPDAIINIVDATNIERNLYLSLQLMELNLPMVIALNMMDEVHASGGSIDVPALERELGVPVVPIAAIRGDGVHELVDTAIAAAEQRRLPRKLDFCTGPVHRAIHSIAHIVEDHAKAAHVPVRFAATKLVEEDELMVRRLNIHANDVEVIRHVVEDMEQDLGTDRFAALADMRYDFITDICSRTVKKPEETREQQRSVAIDKILTHKYLGIPIFLVIMLLVFWLTFNVLGNPLSDLMGQGIDAFTGMVDGWLTAAGVSTVLQSLIIDGIFAGVGSVLSFLPIILALFFFLSMLEDSGYMARVAFVMDKLLRKIGLSGRSFVPMLIGFGCSVPAIMATRTLPSERDRKMTILLTPFMSCSAKLPIYSVFAAAFFPGHTALVMICLYVGSMIVGIVYGLALKGTLFHGNPVPFVMELPAYRLPGVKTTLLHMWEKAKDFIVRAFTIIFLATIVIWLLQNLSFGFHLVEDASQSMLARIGGFVAPLFAPLGFGNWQSVAALVSGLAAKESVVSTFALLLGVSGTDMLHTALPAFFTPLQAASFLTFTVLYMPCMAAFAAARRELGSTGQAVLMMASQCAVAWLVAGLVYMVGGWIGF